MVSPFYKGRIPDHLKCPQCNGEGIVRNLWGEGEFLCLTCRGDGVTDENELVLNFAKLSIRECLECGGKGYVFCNYDHEHECPDCGGDGGELLYAGKPIRPYKLARSLRKAYDEYTERLRFEAQYGRKDAS